MEENLDTFAENTAQFDAYLRGEMPAGERAVFEARLAADPSFRRAFDQHRALLGSMSRNLEREQWRQRLRDARNAQPPEHARPVAYRWWLLALLLVLAGGLYWFRGQGAGKPAPKPPVPVADQGGKPPELLGADRLERRSLSLPTVLVAVRNNQKTVTPDAAGATLELYQTRTDGAAGNIRGNRAQLYLPEKQYQATENYRLLRLNLDGAETTYLQIGTEFFPLSEEDAWLQKVTDEAVLQWLR